MRGTLISRRTLVASAAAVATQFVVFHAVPLINAIYDGWPRGWLVLSVSIFAALLGGLTPGLAALATGIALIWSKGVYFTPKHPGIEIFALIGLLQIAIIHRLHVAQRALIERHDALEAARGKADWLYEMAHQANQAKDEFLAVLSHELRTPLTVVLCYTRMLRDRPEPPDQVARYSEIIERNAVAQLRVVEDLLDVHRALRGGLRMEYAEFDLADVGRSVMESLAPAADAKQLLCTTQLDSIVIEGDPGRLQQALWNVLSNAIKFTPPHGRVGMSARREDGHAVVRVVDTGEGIPPDFLPHVFEPFRQRDMSATRRHRGLGLGLAIVRNIVAAHDGTVDVRSSSSGTEVMLRLPIRRTAAGEPAPMAVSPPRPMFQRAGATGRPASDTSLPD